MDLIPREVVRSTGIRKQCDQLGVVTGVQSWVEAQSPAVVEPRRVCRSSMHNDAIVPCRGISEHRTEHMALETKKKGREKHLEKTGKDAGIAGQGTRGIEMKKEKGDDAQAK